MKKKKQNFKSNSEKHEIFILELPHWKCIEVSQSWISASRRGNWVVRSENRTLPQNLRRDEAMEEMNANRKNLTRHR